MLPLRIRNATDPIWRVLASSLGISSWTPLKLQHSNPNPFCQSTLVYWLPYSSHTSHHPSQTPRLPWISYATQKLMLDSCKMLQKQSEPFHTFLWHFFSSLKHNFIANRSFKVSSRPDCIFEIHQLWQSSFSRVYSNCCCCCYFEAEIIKIGQSSYKMYSNNIVIFHESTTILNAYTKKVWKFIEGTTDTCVCMYIYIHIYQCTCVCIYIYIYICICARVRVYVYMYISVCVCKHGRVYIYIYIWAEKFIGWHAVIFVRDYIFKLMESKLCSSDVKSVVS